MRIVLDANVIVAAFAARGLCESVLELCLDRHDILLSEPLLDEIRKNLQKKVKLPIHTIEQIEHLLRENGTIFVSESISPHVCRDPNDVHVLGLTVAGQAECLVTGDNDLLVLKQFRQCQILNPRAFSILIHQKQG
ncbi:MAG: putative toxin-antitoxin system toxin component, PIN family [Kiritimatiellae bacterium]|jgi:putative PIN family toxin of toxin-antitoxin system|nr:putative toxin-antitoxin system toxin component, PIN family [Kiritimatiellia bacterium]